MLICCVLCKNCLFLPFNQRESLAECNDIGSSTHTPQYPITTLLFEGTPNCCWTPVRRNIVISIPGLRSSKEVVNFFATSHSENMSILAAKFWIFRYDLIDRPLTYRTRKTKRKYVNARRKRKRNSRFPKLKQNTIFNTYND